MSRRSLFVRVAIGAALAVAVAIGCARSVTDTAGVAGPGPETLNAPPPPMCSCGPEPVVDPTLVAFLSKARVAHHQADEAEDAKDINGAIAALEQVLHGPPPGGAHPLPEAAEVLGDTRARLADLKSTIGQFDTALRDIEAGLAVATETTYFRGHLYEVEGLVYDRQAKALEGTNDALADRAKKAAADAYNKSVLVYDSVINSQLDRLDAGAH